MLIKPSDGSPNQFVELKSEDYGIDLTLDATGRIVEEKKKKIEQL